MIRCAEWCVISSCLFGVGLFAEEAAELSPFAKEAANRIEAKPNVMGDEGDWFFLVQELRHLATGKFWESSWEEVSAQGESPVEAMVEFKKLLDERGVRLILAPIPAKARVYPEKLDEDFSLRDTPPLTPFLEELREKGFTVVDLDAELRELRREDRTSRFYCAQDAHYSPKAIEILADRLASELGGISAENPAIHSGTEERIEITGDQIVGSEWEGTVEPESLTVTRIIENEEFGVKPDPESPVLLLGDSHTLVFHAGAETGMHLRGAGLPDQLSYRLGQAVDLVGVRGSGLVQARKQLFFRATSEPGYWDRKRAVVWVFSEREWTQLSD
ncbi:MAG: hypothetical protein AAF491_01680, partial [Verrucomicrobiota bacterium]